MKLQTLLLLLVAASAHTPIFAQTQPDDVIEYDQLATTDGFGLLARPTPQSSKDSAATLNSGLSLCEVDCVTSPDTVLGSVDGVDAYSNCQSNCIRSEYSFMNLQSMAISVYDKDPKDKEQHYVGLIYQCVEYARRWWMKNAGITFGSIDSAYELIYLTEGKDIRSGEKFSLSRSVNGTAKRAPRRGDLLVYYATPDSPNWRFGHVAVVVDVDQNLGLVSLAEQNYSNKKWQDPNAFSRQIKMFEVGGRYQLIDVENRQVSNNSGGQIAGWIYPTIEVAY